MMRGKKLITTVAAIVVAVALLVGPIPGLMNVPSANAAEADSVLVGYGFPENQLSTLFWLLPIGLVTPVMFWLDMHNGAY